MRGEPWYSCVCRRPTYGSRVGGYRNHNIMSHVTFVVMIPVSNYHRPGDKRQLKAQDVIAKLVRFDILRMVPTNNLFCIKST